MLTLLVPLALRLPGAGSIMLLLPDAADGIPAVLRMRAAEVGAPAAEALLPTRSNGDKVGEYMDACVTRVSMPTPASSTCGDRNVGVMPKSPKKVTGMPPAGAARLLVLPPGVSMPAPLDTNLSGGGNMPAPGADDMSMLFMVAGVSPPRALIYMGNELGLMPECAVPAATCTFTAA